MLRNKIAVISTGNGGQAMAAYFAYLGYDTALYARQQERVDMFPSRLFHIYGILDVDVEIGCISCNMEEVIKDAYLIMVTTPAQYHPVIARAMAPYLEDGQMVILNPGRTFGNHAFDQVLRRFNCQAEIILAETDSFAFTCRSESPGNVMIYSMKNQIFVGAHRQELTEMVADRLQNYLPNVQAAPSPYYCDFQNMGMVFHPLPFLLNFAKIERREPFLFYMDGITPHGARMMEKLDTERRFVAAALGIQVMSAGRWLREAYGATGCSLYEKIQNNKIYRPIYAPMELSSRYIFEDISTGCVPISCVAEILDIKTPVINGVIDWASMVYGRDFRKFGRGSNMVDYYELVEEMREEFFGRSI